MIKCKEELGKQNLEIAEWVFRSYFSQFKSEKQDMIQEAVTNLWMNRESFDLSKSNYITFAKTVCRNTMLTYIRDLKFRSHFSLDAKVNGEPIIDTFGFVENSAFEFVDMQLLLSSIHHVTENMDKRSRKIIDLYLKHYSYDEIAFQVGMSKSNVCGYVKRFRQAMSEFLTND